jgi:hypothetical protein
MIEKVSEMTEQRKLIAFVTVILILYLTSVCNAAYFVFHKAGNIRSGPSTKYRVIGQVSNETIVQIPNTFDDYDATWIPIDAKIEYDKKAKTEEVFYTKWVHTSLGAVVKGEIQDVEKYLAMKSFGWSNEIQELILKGELKTGMTTHMVFYAWGRPNAINETTTPDGVREQWVYEQPGSKTQYLYFENGLLTAIQK